MGIKHRLTLSAIEDEIHRADSRPTWRKLLDKADRVREAAKLMPWPVARAGKQLKLLDLGCGLGYASLLWQDMYRDATVVAVDLSTRYLGETRAVEWLAARPGKVNHVAADAHRLPFHDGTFDAIWSGQVLYRTDPCTVIHEIRRVLKIGGRWVGLENATPLNFGTAEEFAGRYGASMRRGRPIPLTEWRDLAKQENLT
ncbi:MAG: class I SAM-dependent methyltransferase, partial [Candidatus Kerfeldbacteria bacterium]|nr:class I SAM-dependent methyltransferase [Candidatus Kerfeldbacteria bacterium]